MERLNVIPYPNRVTFINGTADAAKVMAAVEERLAPDSMKEEAYHLTVRDNAALIVAATPRGLFYGRKTLEQLAANSCIPCLRIEDEPAYPYRGFMVDTVRHTVSIEDTKKIIDAMASVKMNTMHWHLSDDQGWRVQVNSFPKLMSEAAMRPASRFGDENDDTPYGTWFTKEQIREVVAYAAERFIDVVPEIDMPGHMSALLHAYPEFSCSGEPVEMAVKQGIYPDILCAGKEETYQAVFKILDELTALFPAPYFHIGGDEAPKTHWKACPDCQNRIREWGLKNEEELQCRFTDRVRKYLAAKGKKTVVWNESLKGGSLCQVRVQYWMHDLPQTVKYANLGGQVIMSDFYHYYADYPYAQTPLRKTYEFDPLVKGLNAIGRRNIVGVETPLWTEYVRDFDKFCYMAFPRFTAVAETGWTKKANKDEADFERRFRAYTPLLNALGITPAPPEVWNPTGTKRIPELWKFYKPVIRSQLNMEKKQEKNKDKYKNTDKDKENSKE